MFITNQLDRDHNQWLRRIALVLTTMGICMLLQAHLPMASALPHIQSPQDINAESFYQAMVAKAEEKDTKNITYLRMDPVDLHVNVGDHASFEIYLSKPLTSEIEVELHCSSEGDGQCATFNTSDLHPIILPAGDHRVTVNLTLVRNGHDVVEASVSNASLEALKARDPSLHVDTEDFGFIRIRVGRSNFLTILGSVFGWVYFVAWSVSFWPQNISNYKRKSVVGLNFDYTILHFTGFLFYSIFNMTLFFSAGIQGLYEVKFPRSEIPVELNDVVYSIHAAAATSITWTQCMIYERGDQRLSIYGKLFQAAAWTVGGILSVLSIFSIFSWLETIYYFSYVKLVITAVKYLPQMFFNFRRKSTAGWSIYMIYLDITGGSMSMLQMLTIAYNYNDWKTLLGNLPKLGLAIASMFYDVIFLLQEFVFFPKSSSRNANQNTGGDSRKKSFTASLGLPSLSRRNTLKEAGDSQDQLCKQLDSSISSLSSSIGSTNSSNSGAPNFTVPMNQNLNESNNTNPKSVLNSAKTGTLDGTSKTIDLSTGLDSSTVTVFHHRKAPKTSTNQEY